MNTAELETMQETIRAMADAIGELSTMCEGLPRFLETKIGEFRAEMKATFAGMMERLQAGEEDSTKAVSALASQQSSLEGRLQVFQESIGSVIESSAAETRQIIADNRVELEAQITTNKLAARQQLQEGLAEVRAACDTTDLHHGLAVVKATAEQHDKALGEITTAVGAGDKAFAELRTVTELVVGEVKELGKDMLAVPEQIAAAVGESTRAVGDQIGAATAEIGARHTAQTGEVAEALRGEIGAVAKRVDDSMQMIVRAESGFVNMLQSAEQRAAEELGVAMLKMEATTAPIVESVESIRSQCDQTEEIIVAHKAAIAQVGEQVTTATTAILDRVAPVEQAVVQIRAAAVESEQRTKTELTAIAGRLEEHDGLIARVVGSLEKAIAYTDEAVGGLREQHTKDVAEVQSTVQENERRTTAQLGSITGRVDHHVERISKLAESVDGLKAHTDETVNELREQQVQSAIEIRAGMQADKQGVDETIGKITVRLEDHASELVQVATDMDKLRLVITGAGDEFRSLHSACYGEVKDLRESLVSKEAVLSQRVADVEDTVKEIPVLRNTCIELIKRDGEITGLLELTNKTVAEVAASAESLNGHVDSEFQAIRAEAGTTAEAVETLRGLVVDAGIRIGAANERIETIGVDLVGAKALFEETVSGITQSTVERTAAVDEKINTAFELIGSTRVALEAECAGRFNDLEERRTKDNRETDKRIGEAVAFTKTCVAEAVQGFMKAVDADAVLDDVRREHTEQWTGTLAVINEVKENVDAITAKVNEVVSPSLAALEEKVRAFQPGVTPEQLAELQTRLVSQIPEPAKPEFELAYEDGRLVVTALYENGEGQKAVSATVPVDIAVKYRGVYKPNQDYPAGNVVSHSGSMWVSRGSPTGAPGKDFTGWQLAVKCGRDGKDAQPIRTYTKHDPKNVYRESDFLRVNNRLWQCAVKETSVVPEPGDITSTPEWLLIGGVH